jgi:DNA-binding CsgD family transcriptional regulator
VTDCAYRGTVTPPAARAARWERGADGIERLSREGLDLASFRHESLRRLRSLMSVDAAFFASVDPATMLFTSALAESPLAEVTPRFLDNEFGQEDVNKFAFLAASSDPVGSLDRATKGARSTSERYREVLAPLGFGDELRVALTAGNCCWGVLCLHREDSPNGFDSAEIDLVRRLAPHLAFGLRHNVRVAPAPADTPSADGPGIIILGVDGSVISVNARAETLLADVADPDWSTTLALPAPVHAAIAQVTGRDGDHPAAASATRLRRSQGGWIAVHASVLNGTAGSQVAVVLDAADRNEVSSLALAAHGLTPAQCRVAGLVLQGRSTRCIVDELHISSNTLQEHLRAVFDKFGVGNRRELIVALSGRSG